MAAKIPDGYNSWRDYYASIGMADYFDKYLSEFTQDEGIEGFKAKWYNNAYEISDSVESAVKGGVEGVKLLFIVGLAVGAWVLLKKLK